MIIKIYNTSEIAMRYFKKLRVPVKDRSEAHRRFKQLRKYNSLVLNEILKEAYNEQQELLRELYESGKIKMFDA